MAVVVVGAGVLFGRSVAALAATGALYASIVDQPAPLSIKWRIFLLDIAGASAVTLLASLAGGSPWLLGPLIAVISAGTGLMSAYGRRALGLGVAAMLALLFGMATHKASLPQQLTHTAIFAGGGALYAVVALILAALLDDRIRQLYLGEAMLAFSRYIARQGRTLRRARQTARRAAQAGRGACRSRGAATGGARHDLRRAAHAEAHALDRGAHRPPRRLRHDPVQRCRHRDFAKLRTSSPDAAIAWTDLRSRAGYAASGAAIDDARDPYRPSRSNRTASGDR